VSVRRDDDDGRKNLDASHDFCSITNVIIGGEDFFHNIIIVSVWGEFPKPIEIIEMIINDRPA
jgi:hypothetical protein